MSRVKNWFFKNALERRNDGILFFCTISILILIQKLVIEKVMNFSSCFYREKNNIEFVSTRHELNLIISCRNAIFSSYIQCFYRFLFQQRNRAEKYVKFHGLVFLFMRVRYFHKGYQVDSENNTVPLFWRIVFSIHQISSLWKKNTKRDKLT